MTYYASIPRFTTAVTWEFLKPVALAGAISLAVNYFIWPDNSISNFLGVLRQTLDGYNAFFKEHSNAFLDLVPPSSQSTLPQLHTRLQNGVLLMIECKRAVQREITFSRISDQDCSRLTKSVRSMRASLHGIGLSFIIKSSYLNSDNRNLYFSRFKNSEILNAFSASLESLKPISAELTQACTDATGQCLDRITKLHYHPRTGLNSILWPFPRFWVSRPKVSNIDTENQPAQISSTTMKELIVRFDEMSKSSEAFKKFLELDPADLPRNGPLYLISLYLYNLREHAVHITSFIELVEELEAKRKNYRLWFPHQTLSRWLHSGDQVDGAVGVDVQESENVNAGNDLARCSTRNDDNRRESDERTVFNAGGEQDKDKYRKNDPDVSLPVTPMQKFFNAIYVAGRWLTSTTTFFAFKTALGVVMLAIPAWRPQDAGWYIEWRGQWAMITLVLWMFPMTGAFIFGLIDRVIGSIVGAVLGIIVWEITRGNPYGLAVLSFVIFLPLYYIFFFVAKFRVAALMSKITMILVIIYEYNYAVSGVAIYDQVYTVAGKRLLMVVIGIAASGILIAIPFPPTSRVELRKRLASTIRDIGKAYGILAASTIAIIDEPITDKQSKGFQKLAIELRRQIAEEHTLLHQANYEPPLRGYFPAENYKTLVQIVDNMSDLVINMASSLARVKPEWKRHIGSILGRERKEYLSSILSTLKMISSTLYAKTSLPPYMLSPIECRENFVNILEKKIMIEPSDIANPSFPSYSSYLMNSLVFVDELQVLLSVVQDLVGVENPEQWLNSRS
ncbi:hypothetical protein RMCBS344292_19306 [Rhizopus microsporus]|nr:hypothetical protein RMCBS344292_19306 [Rhizopus microsporus]